MKRGFSLILMVLLASLASGVVLVNPYQFAAAPSFSGEVYYVDPSDTGSLEDGSSAEPYKSLNAALKGKCNKTLTQPIRILCRTTGSVADTVRVDAWVGGYMGSCVTSSSNYIEIMADTGHWAGATWDSAKYNLAPAYSAQAGTVINISQNYVRLRGLQMTISSHTAGQVAEYVYWSLGNTGYMESCHIKGLNNSEYTRGISSIDGINLINTVIYNLGSNVSSTCIKNHGNSYFYNCTFIGNGSAIQTVDLSDGACVAKNSYAGGASWEDWSVGSGSLTRTTVASGDSSTGSVGLRSIAVNTTNFTNVTAGSYNLSLPSGSALKATGTTLSGESTPFNYTTDITGATRSGTWDIGAVKF